MTIGAHLTDTAMNDLERLREKLSLSFEHSLGVTYWGQPQLMTKALAEVKKVFDAPTSEMPERSIAKVLAGYRSSGMLQSFLDLKYACFGVGQRFADGWCLLNDDQLFGKLLDHVDGLLPEPRRFRKGYQGLLSSYFSYSIFTCEYKKNWELLSGYLLKRLQVAKQATPAYGWLNLLEEHSNLLGPKPCERYVQEVRKGNSEVIHQMLQEGLGVPRESWVWQELILSQVEVACSLDDQNFNNDLERLLKMLGANSTHAINLVIRCVAMLVSRYTRCSSKPEHPALCDAAVSHIGNPWLKRTAWDAHVKTEDGQPHEAAREMVNGWIKRRLIKDFFEILSDDGSADQRRLNYWLRFEPVVGDMWFALGPYASKHPSPDFKDFRNRAKGRLLKLEVPGVPQNNAFIMRLGSVTVVEFGSRGNATYVYRSEGLPFDLNKSWINGDGTGLKNLQVGERLFHRDFDSTGEKWEEKFDETLCPLIDFWPTKRRDVRRRAITKPQSVTIITKPAFPQVNSVSNLEVKVKDLCKKLRFSMKDQRAAGGAFWVMYYSENCPELKQLGFRFKPGKGWWKE